MQKRSNSNNEIDIQYKVLEIFFVLHRSINSMYSMIGGIHLEPEILTFFVLNLKKWRCFVNWFFCVRLIPPVTCQLPAARYLRADSVPLFIHKIIQEHPSYNNTDSAFDKTIDLRFECGNPLNLSYIISGSTLFTIWHAGERGLL